MFRKRHPPVGARPGTLMIHSGAQRPRIHVMKYHPGHLEEHDVSGVEQLRGVLAEGSVCWIDVQGLGDETLLRALAEMFSIHSLALENVVNVPQRPKVESYESHTLCIARMAMSHEAGTATSEQVSLFVGSNYVLTFQERYGDVFEPVRNRIRQGGPIFRALGPGYLAYALLDAVIDGYYPIMESFGEHLENLEDEIVTDFHASILPRIHHVKRELLV
jgi:magnesium transporter